jgi:large subunit ribosomal protein L4e
MNDKERKLALISALGATADLKLVAARGHKLSKNLTLPVVVEDEFEELATTKEVIKSLQHLGVYEDVCRARDGKHLRASRGRMRGRRYRIPKSLLIVVSKFRGIERGARNLPGLDIITPSGLNTEQLAPGGTPGRLTLFTESALNIVGSR